MYLILTHRLACKIEYKFKLFFVLTERVILYEECDIDMQCNRTNVSGVCKELGHRKFCLCENGYMEENSDLKCRKGNTSLMLRIVSLHHD